MDLSIVVYLLDTILISMRWNVRYIIVNIGVRELVRPGLHFPFYIIFHQTVSAVYICKRPSVQVMHGLYQPAPASQLIVPDATDAKMYVTDVMLVGSTTIFLIVK